MGDWIEEAEQMLKTWTQAQKNVWDSWQDFAGRVGGAAPTPREFAMNPMEWLQQSMSAWTDSTGVAGDAGRQVLVSQLSMMRNLDMLTKAWQTVAPMLDAGKDWRAPLSDFTSNWFRQLTGAPQGLYETSKDTASLFQSYMNLWGSLLRPWLSSALEATGSGHLGEMMLGGSAGLSRLFTMEQDALQLTPFTGLADIPSVGVAREHQAMVLRAFDAFVDMREVMLKFNKMTISALSRTVEKVMQTLAEKSKKGEKIESIRDLNRLWLDSADDVFTKMYAAEEYLAAQRELSSAGMRYKIMQQDVVEMVLEKLNLPTRSEVDDAYKMLYELRKEVKSLKKELRGRAAPPIRADSARRNAIKQVTTKPVVKKVAVRKKTT
jgi:class III poly(R)-hydroxyalkanoic acid synthase PhaE subunit